MTEKPFRAAPTASTSTVKMEAITDQLKAKLVSRLETASKALNAALTEANGLPKSEHGEHFRKALRFANNDVSNLLTWMRDSGTGTW